MPSAQRNNPYSKASVMAGHQSSHALSTHALSPQLSNVLGSLSISLEAELNRYRRNRRIDEPAADDLFAGLEDPSFDLEAMEQAVEASVAQTATLARPMTPPPVPQNKKILAANSASESQHPKQLAPANASALAVSTATNTTAAALAIQPAAEQATQQSPGQLDGPGSNVLAPGGELTPRLQSTGTIEPTGYLASSEKLIESLAEMPAMPDPIDTTSQPKRKTVSLLAGASLGLLGLIAGLGASYLMANPLVTQQLASRFQGKSPEVIADAESSFDPPGPDLSANEFIDLEIDNLSSLRMPQTAVVPNADTLERPADAGSLPPIESPTANTAPSSTADTTQPSGANVATVTTPTLSSGAALSRPVAPASIETQAVVVPVGLTYYVTAPFTTEQNLINIRESVSEAFVRRFSEGNRIQIAAFDNPQAAQSFVEELSAQNISAQIYGPTTE